MGEQETSPEPLYFGHTCREGCKQSICPSVEHEKGQNLQFATLSNSLKIALDARTHNRHSRLFYVLVHNLVGLACMPTLHQV
jgi:hypothetical protein